MLGFLVPAVAWYRNRRGEDVVLPAETLVPYAGLLAAGVRAAGAAGRFALWQLPRGGYATADRQLPLVPVDVDKVFPLGAADVPWSAGGDLARDWQLLFRERAVFEPWGDAGDDALLRQYLRHRPPRVTFRAGPGRRERRFLYPQLVPARLAYRLGDGYFKLAEPLRKACRPLVAEGDRVRLTAGAAVEDLRHDATPERLAALAAELESGAPFWSVEAPEAHSPLLIVPH